MRNRIVVIGDSHSVFCFGGIAEAEIYWLGPVTMHRVGRDGLRRLLFDKRRWIGWNSVEAAVLSFGEIDCRSHVETVAARTGRSIDAVLEELAGRYLEAVTPYAARTRIAVSCVVPPAPKDPPEQGEIRQRLNRLLAAGCRANGLGFVDFYAAQLQIVDGRHVDHRNNEAVCRATEAVVGRPLRYEQAPPVWMRRAKPEFFRALRWRLTGRGIE